MRGRRRNFSKTEEITVTVDSYRIGRIGDIPYNQPFSFTCLRVIR
jgi:hypothetical protein